MLSGWVAVLKILFADFARFSAHFMSKSESSASWHFQPEAGRECICVVMARKTAVWRGPGGWHGRERESDNISSIILRNIWEFPKEGGPNMVP